MTTEELQNLFNDLKREIVGLKTDLVILRYDVEQLDKKLDEVKIMLATSNTDPLAGKIIERL